MSKNDKFTQQMEEKFRRDLQNINLDGEDQDQLQSSTDFFQGLKKKINIQITQIKNNQSTNLALQQIKQNINNQENQMTKFNEQIQEVKLFNDNHQNVINEEKVTQIKLKVARQANQSRIILTEQIVTQEMEIRKQSSKKSQAQNVSFSKKKVAQQQDDFIKVKIEQANRQRERVSMERQDQISMKYQMQVLSDFFKSRFFNLQVKNVYQSTVNLNIKVRQPKNTFTNLAPLANNEANVLPKNSPQIALKNLKKNKKIKLQPISKTTIKISFKKEEQNENVTNKILQQSKQNKQIQTNPQSHEHQAILIKYLQKISKPLKRIESISKSYKPKFLKHHLNQNQKTSNIDISQIESGQKSLSSVIQNQLLEIGQTSILNLKQFKLTFEDITDLKGIQTFKNIQYAALQHNMIKDITNVKLCQRLIQLNLSNNSIKSCKAVQNLPWLRFINMNNNKLKQLQLKGGSLQIGYFNKNNIQKIINLNNNKNLRIIQLNQNNLHQISGVQQLYFLQQFLLNKNYINSLKGTDQLILLQRLQLSHNRIEKIEQPVIFLYLNLLDLSFNKIDTLKSMFLPSLEKLYLFNNKIKGKMIQKSMIYLPQLKEFNIDDNQLEGFSGIWAFIRYSTNLQILKYDNNEYFLSVRQKVRQLYEAIIYKNMSNLKILNHAPMDTGMKAYYDSMYRGYLKSSRMFEQKHNLLNNIEKLITFLLKQSKTIYELENQQSKIKNQRFVESDLFVYYKSVKKASSLIKLSQIISENIQKKKEQSKNIILRVNSSIYFHHDKFESDFLEKIHKIKSFYYRYRYRLNKRKKYFLKNKDKIQILVKFFNSALKQNQSKKVVQKFGFALRALNQNDAAIKIQKVWRGYKIRKIFKILLKKMRNKDNDDEFQLQQVDLEGFQCQDFPQFDFSMPQNVHFDQYIIEPKYFQVAEIQKNKRNPKVIQEKPGQQDDEKQYKPLLNNFMDKSHQSQQIKQKKKKDKQDEDARIMREWGFTDPKSLEMMRMKGKQKDERAKKQAQKHLSASQRFAKFKNQKY